VKKSRIAFRAPGISSGAIAICIVSSSAGAQVAPAPSAPVPLSTITVTATRGESGPEAQPVSASVVTTDQLQATPAQALDDVLRSTAGVNLPDYSSWAQHPTANLISMRGLGGYARALVLRDGVPLNDPFFGYVQWNRVPLEAVDRVEVIRGAYASVWGNYAMGGVVNIISREPTRSDATLDAAYGSRDTSRFNANGSWVKPEAFRIDANVSQWRTDGYNEVPPDMRAPLDIPTAFKARSAELTVDGNIDASMGGFMRAGYHEDHQQLGTPLSTNWQRNIDLAAGLHKRFDDASRVALTAYHTDEEFWTANNGTPDGFARGYAEYIQNIHTTPVTDTGVSAVWSKRFSNELPSVSTGADLRYIKGEDTAQIYDETGEQVRTDVGRGKQRFIGVFAQAEYYPWPKLQLAAGLRYEDWKNFDGYDGNPGGIGDTPDRSASSTNPRIAARYALDDNWSLRAAGYKAFRAPNLGDLYRGYSIPGGTFLPNSELKPERLTGGEFGVDYERAGFRAQLTAYTNTIKDLLTFRNLGEDELPPGFFFGSVNINAGKARTNGAELSAQWNLAPGWDSLFAYAYNDAKILENPADPTTAGHTEGGIPKQAASAQLLYDMRNGFKASTRVRYVQGYYTDNAGTLPIQSYAIVDLSVSYAATRTLELYANIENLFNRQFIAQNSGNATPTLGTPFTFLVGVRIKAL